MNTPVDVTEEFIHIRVLDPDQFETCRLTDFDGKLPKGARAKYCKYADKDEWATQAYLFEKAEGWDLEKAKNFVKTHKGFSLSYYASAAPREENGRKLVDIQVIDTTRNANNWRVTDQGLKRALNSLIGVPLLAYPDHSGTVLVGRFVDASKPDGYAIGTAEITDPVAWEKIKRKEWKWVSPQVYAFDTREEDGCEVLNSFSFQHVAFVPNPAYESVRVLNAAASGGPPTFSAALTGFLEERNLQFQNNQSGTAARPALEAGKNKKKGEEEKTLSQDIQALQTKVTELSETNKTLTGKNTELETSVRTLKASLDTIAAERHAEKVLKLLELRGKAGLYEASKKADEETRLVKLADAVLDQLIVDAETFVKALPKPSGPKATFSAEEQVSAEEQTRERLFGYKRDKDGKIVGGV